MEKNIYDLLNEVEVDLNEYEPEEFSKLEEKRILKKLFNKKEKSVNNYNKYIAAASVAVISFGVALPTVAMMNPIMYKIANILGIEKNLDEYTTVVDQMVTSKDGISVGLGEVIYDQENYKLKVVTHITSPEKIEKDMITSTFTRVRINGEELNSITLITTKYIDENTVAFIQEHQINEKLTGKLDIRISIPQVQINDELYHNIGWTFEFTTDGDKLAEDTKVIELGNKFTLSNGETVELVKYTSNALNHNIFYETNDFLEGYIIELRGTDNLGNEMTFQFSFGNSGKGGIMTLCEDTELSPEAENMTLGLYALELPEQDGLIVGEFEQVGEKFSIDLK